MLEVDKNGDILQKLKVYSRLFSNSMKFLDNRFVLKGGEGDAPLFLLSLKERLDSRLEEERLLQEIAEQVRVRQNTFRYKIYLLSLTVLKGWFLSC